ncbi:MAG: hypothetical protein CMK09_04230 [Ponticaulis sp.]|nr:hypothetical protein [Ponticaulis sp.]|tara:strand:- start:9782 stop:10261 length:480 start_codon:yes stop_codon:yes gene_type:complete
MTPEDLTDIICSTYDGVIFKPFWGDQSFFYNPENRLSNGTYFATMKLKDGENDSASHINREGVWRLNIGLPVKAFEARFGKRPTRPAQGQSIEGEWDFTTLNTLTPHPVYGWMGWAAILSPSRETYDTHLAPILDQAYHKARQAFDKRMRALERSAAST